MSKALEIEQFINEAVPGAPVAIVIEDHPVFLEILRDAFTKAGMKVLIATDAETGKTLVSNTDNPVAFVVIDYDLGVGKGDEVAKVAKEHNIGPLYLFSAEPSRADHSLYDKVYDKNQLLGMLSDLLFGSAKEDALEALEMMEVIKKEGSNYVLRSKKGKLLGKHKTKKQAQKQMAAVEISKHGG